jgi:hypothetical protein
MSSAPRPADSPPPACFDCLLSLADDVPTPRLAPHGFKDLPTGEQRKWLKDRIRSEQAEASQWNLHDNDPCITFAQAIETEWCRFKTEKKLTTFMRRHGFPERLVPKVITEAAYLVAEKKAEAARQGAERLRKRSKRKAAAEKAKSAADTH